MRKFTILGYIFKPIYCKKKIGRRVYQSIYNPLMCGTLGGILILFFYTDILIQWDAFVKFFGPESGFSWGECEKILIERKDFRDNIFWVIVIGFPLAIIANIIVAFLVSKRSDSHHN